MVSFLNFVFFFKQKTAYEIGVRLVGSEMCIRDREKTAPKNTKYSRNETILKIGHHAKAIALAKSSLWVKN